MRYSDLVSRFQTLWNLKESSVRLSTSYLLRKEGFTFHWESTKILHKALQADLIQSALVVTSRSNNRQETIPFSPYTILNRVREKFENDMNEKFMSECEDKIGAFLEGMSLDTFAKHIKELSRIEGNLSAISQASEKMDSLQDTQDYSQSAMYQKRMLNQRLQTEGTIRIQQPLQSGAVIGGQ
jgi:hypothetical protein